MKEQRKVLIVGAGEAGLMTAKALLRHPDSELRPVGFLDDDSLKRDKQFWDLPVFGALAELPEVIGRVAVDEVIIAIPSAPGQVIRHVIDLARHAHLRYRTLPSLQEILSGSVSALGIREVKLEDLLRREPVK